MNLAIIPARSGSKGVPGKNTKKLGGVPLILWTLEAALLAGEAESIIDKLGNESDDDFTIKPLFDVIAITSDSAEILDVCKHHVLELFPEQAKAVIFYLRDEKLGVDHVQTDEVCLDMMRSMESAGIELESICLLQPTSPFRTYQHLNESYKYWTMARDNPMKQAKCLISGIEKNYDVDGYGWFGSDENAMMVEPIGHNPTFRMGRQWEKPLPTRLYQENGAIYWFSANEFSLRRFYRMEPFAMYPMSEQDSVDINTPDDWELAEAMVNGRWGAK